jgi:hypothetical protein
LKKLFVVLALIGFSAIAYAHGMSESDKIAMLNAGNLQYIWLGATHMLSGYDHLLFLFGVIFFLTNTKDIIKFVTAFTIGHSITLILATFFAVRINYYIIDAVIALSVIYKGFDNNGYFKSYLGWKKSPNLLFMVVGFGLIHGFGLSTRLQELPLGEPGMSMLLRIVNFNIGVELGQILALIIILIILNALRKLDSFVRYSKIANHLIMFLGFLLLLMQLHGYIHVKEPNELGFAKKTHMHIHEDMEIEK